MKDIKNEVGEISLSMGDVMLGSTNIELNYSVGFSFLTDVYWLNKEKDAVNKDIAAIKSIRNIGLDKIFATLDNKDDLNKAEEALAELKLSKTEADFLLNMNIHKLGCIEEDKALAIMMEYKAFLDKIEKEFLNK